MRESTTLKVALKILKVDLKQRGHWFYFFAEDIVTKKRKGYNIGRRTATFKRYFKKYNYKDDVKLGTVLIFSVTRFNDTDSELLRPLNEKSQQKFIDDNAEYFV